MDDLHALPCLRDFDWGTFKVTDDEIKLANALRTHGFALVKSTIPCKAVMTIAGNRRFALQAETKRALSKGPRDGYQRSAEKEHFYFPPTSAARQASAVTHVRNAVSAYAQETVEIAKRCMWAVNGVILKANVADHNTDFVGSWFGRIGHRPSYRGHCNLSEASIVTDHFYHEADEGTIRAAAHVDRGLLTVISNPSEVEIRIGDSWVRPYSAERFAGMDVVLVLVGFTLEKATNGLLRAALHRVVSDGGTRRSTVLDVRVPSWMTICPAALAPPPPRGEELDEYERAAREPFVASDLLAQFDATHASINAPTPAGIDSLPTLGAQPPENHPLLLELLMQILLAIESPAGVAQLAGSCVFLRALAAREAVWVPLAERHRVDWNLALDRIDQGAPSLGRAPSQDPVQAPAALLEAMRSKWVGVIGAELNLSTHLRSRISI